jgi:hypothetical protein
MMEHPYDMTEGHSFSSKTARAEPNYWREGVEEMKALDAKEGMTPEEKEAFGGL